MINAAARTGLVQLVDALRVAAMQAGRRALLTAGIGVVAVGIVLARLVGGPLADVLLIASTAGGFGTLVVLGALEIGRLDSAHENRLRLLVANTSEAVAVIAPNGEIKFANPAAEQIVGIRAAISVGRPVFDFFDRVHPDERAAMTGRLQDVLAKHGAADTAVVRLRVGDANDYRTLEVTACNRTADPAVNGIVFNMRDVTDQLIADAQVSRLETAVKSASGVARKLAEERAFVAETIRRIDSRSTPEEIAQAVCVQVATIPGVAMASVFVFDHNGPLVPYGMALSTGEAAPRRQVPRARSLYLRDQAGRGPWIESWNGLPSHPYNSLLAELGVRAHAYAPVRDADRVIGLLVVGSADSDAEEQLAAVLPAVVECADICGTLIGVPVAKRTEAKNQRQRITRISDQHEFTTVFQPLIDTVSGCVVGYEALTRFADGTPPDVRFAEADAAGVGVRLEIAAIRSALAAAASLPGHLWLNVNASPQAVTSAELKQLIEQTSRELVLEVTEHQEITDYPAFRLAVRGLGARVRLAVDDAGAGFAGLRHIVELRPAIVKLDRQLIADIDSDDARQAMVAGMVHFARNSGSWLIAEGVETKAEMAYLRSLQVRYMQGYLLGQPAPPERFADDGDRWIGR